MRKLFVLICALSILTGCVKKAPDAAAASQTAYEGYYKAIEENTKYESATPYYTVSGEMAGQPDGTYRYYIILDQVQIAMYDIAMLAVENGTPYAEAHKMMPNIGIYDSAEFNMIPYQTYAEGGYVKGIVISGESAESSVDLELMVEWTDKNHEQYRRQFLHYVIDAEKGLYNPDAAEEEVTEETEEGSGAQNEG